MIIEWCLQYGDGMEIDYNTNQFREHYNFNFSEDKFIFQDSCHVTWQGCE